MKTISKSPKHVELLVVVNKKLYCPKLHLFGSLYIIAFVCMYKFRKLYENHQFLGQSFVCKGVSMIFTACMHHAVSPSTEN